VDAFWSLSMYDQDSYLVDNSVNRYAVGDRSGLRYADDGSLRPAIQHDSQGGVLRTRWVVTCVRVGAVGE
jgi:hypothetical protein